MSKSKTEAVRRWRDSVPHKWEDWSENDFRLCESYLLDVTSQLEAAEKQLERVRGVVDISKKPHLKHPIGGNDCERVRVYEEIKQALDNKPIKE
jgi:hypothetical protein